MGGAWVEEMGEVGISFRFGVCGCGSLLNGNTGQTDRLERRPKEARRPSWGSGPAFARSPSPKME